MRKTYASPPFAHSEYSLQEAHSRARCGRGLGFQQNPEKARRIPPFENVGGRGEGGEGVEMTEDTTHQFVETSRTPLLRNKIDSSSKHHIFRQLLSRSFQRRLSGTEVILAVTIELRKSAQGVRYLQTP